MRAVIHPSVPRGAVAAPPSKSMAHRLLICAGLARGESRLRGMAELSEDIAATVDCLRALGASITREGDAWRVAGCDPRQAESALLPCRESGSTLRFMLPLCLLSGRPMVLSASEGLLRRPLTVYEDLLRRRGIPLEKRGGEIRVAGALVPGEYEAPGGVSSQFISGLLFALPLLPAPSVLRVLPPVESRPYLDMTLRALMEAGVRVASPDENAFAVTPSAYAPRDVQVEGDWSNAAFFLALNCLGGRVRVDGLDPDSLQGDRICPQYLAALQNGAPELDVSDCPDLAPALLAVAAACHGGVLKGTRRLRFKESDRGAAMARELAKFGVRVQVEENRITVDAASLRPPREPLSSHNDHRIAMALALPCMLTGGEIRGAEAVRKSLPDYWERLQSLGVSLELLP